MIYCILFPSDIHFFSQFIVKCHNLSIKSLKISNDLALLLIENNVSLVTLQHSSLIVDCSVFRSALQTQSRMHFFLAYISCSIQIIYREHKWLNRNLCSVAMNAFRNEKVSPICQPAHWSAPKQWGSTLSTFSKQRIATYSIVRLNYKTYREISLLCY